MSEVRALAPKRAEVDVELDVTADAHRPRDPAGSLDLDGMPLAVANGQCMKLEARLASLGQRRGRVEPAAQQDDCKWF